MGAPAAHALAARGLKVLALDQFGPANASASSWGGNRIFRKAYFEDEKYIPCLFESEKLWRRAERALRSDLLVACGLLIMAKDLAASVGANVLANAAKHGVGIEKLSAADIGRRWPQFLPAEGVFEPGAGFMHVERSIHGFCHLARAAGAELRFPEKVLELDPVAIRVKTDAGEYRAEKLVVAGGTWTSSLLPLPMKVEIQKAPVFWLKPFPGQDSLPCFAFADEGRFVYGFPALEGSVKIAEYKATRVLRKPEDKPAEAEPAEWEHVAGFARRYLPDLRLKKSGVCMYTTTADENFILDALPGYPDVIVGTGGSGHAFKFAPFIGERLADLVQGNKTGGFDLEFWRFR